MPNGKPNILILFGDDIGISNLSCYSMGMIVANQALSLAEFPRRQAPPSFSIDQVIAKLTAGITSS